MDTFVLFLEGLTHKSVKSILKNKISHNNENTKGPPMSYCFYVKSL